MSQQAQRRLPPNCMHLATAAYNFSTSNTPIYLNCCLLFPCMPLCRPLHFATAEVKTALPLCLLLLFCFSRQLANATVTCRGNQYRKGAAEQKQAGCAPPSRRRLGRHWLLHSCRRQQRLNTDNPPLGARVAAELDAALDQRKDGVVAALLANKEGCVVLVARQGAAEQPGESFTLGRRKQWINSIAAYAQPLQLRAQCLQCTADHSHTGCLPRPTSATTGSRRAAA